MVQNNKALVVIDMQNDITKHYRDIIGNINAAIEWAVVEGMHIVYIKHNNTTEGTRTFKLMQNVELRTFSYPSLGFAACISKNPIFSNPPNSL